MIIGEYESKVGEKKRVAIPKKIRVALGKDLILTRGYEGCLVLVNRKMWENIASPVMNGSFINQGIRDTTRFLVGSAVEVDTDSQGRFVIPDALFAHGKLSSDIVFVGLVNWVELWDKKVWEERINYIAQNSSEIAQEIGRSSEAQTNNTKGKVK